LITVDKQIHIINQAICRHFANFTEESRGALSQDILKNLRDFVEAISVKACGEIEYHHTIFKSKAKSQTLANPKLKFLSTFHRYLEQTVSHYLPDEENSERLMLKYYEYLLRIKSFLKNTYNFDVLENIDKFPIYRDRTLQEYYDKISLKINRLVVVTHRVSGEINSERYYIKKIKPFFVNQEIYYEITFTIADDNVSKFDGVIAFTKLNILPNYSVKLSIRDSEIEIFGKTMPIHIIDNWEVAIRPCELNHFADIFGVPGQKKIYSTSKEALNLMSFLTKNSLNLVEVITVSDKEYQSFRDEISKDAQVISICSVLDKARQLIKNDHPGSNVIRYLLYSLNNKIIKSQSNNQSCFKLSNLNLQWGCIPFDEMPYATSLNDHNPKIKDLFDCIDLENRQHELLAKRIKNNTEKNGILYTPSEDLDAFENIDGLIELYNNKLYRKHKLSQLKNYKNHIYIQEREDDTFQIITRLKELSMSGIKNYSNSVASWLQSTSDNVDCDHKKEILKMMFENSKVSLIYGAAGTGKTRLIEHVSNFFSQNRKLYLANTNSAINNLQSRIGGIANSSFKTISSFLHSNRENTDLEILVIDECSTVSNSDMLKVINKASFTLLILVGDIFQIESIHFGNWFSIAKELIPETSIFELSALFRSKNKNLLNLWKKVRTISDDVLEHLSNNNFSSKLDESIFERLGDDEIILCLNYDGLYGINNINKFLQGNNKNKEVHWGINCYKVGDPILFNESDRFRPLIHNNLKGEIRAIRESQDQIEFDVQIDKSINEFEASRYRDLQLLDESSNGKSVIRFHVDRLLSTDGDEESSILMVPFQVAYAVSIHKAQGLEYSSVKVIITDEIETMVTHNLLYTAITRAKEKLKIYWTPETEKKILDHLQHKFNKKDMYLLKAKFNI
jgi:hypothetical protein